MTNNDRQKWTTAATSSCSHREISRQKEEYFRKSHYEETPWCNKRQNTSQHRLCFRAIAEANAASSGAKKRWDGHGVSAWQILLVTFTFLLQESGEEGLVGGQAGGRGWNFGGRWSCSCSKCCLTCLKGKSHLKFVQWNGWCNWKCNYTHKEWSSLSPWICWHASVGETRLHFQSLKHIKQPLTIMLWILTSHKQWESTHLEWTITLCSGMVGAREEVNTHKEWTFPWPGDCPHTLLGQTSLHLQRIKHINQPVTIMLCIHSSLPCFIGCHQYSHKHCVTCWCPEWAAASLVQ